MRVAFYAPLKPPDHPVPSGDRRVAQLFLEALRLAGHEPILASRFRSFEGHGDRIRQARLAALGARLANRFLRRCRGNPAAAPKLWFTYHVYHKAPDWLGPLVSRALAIPYVIAEGSFAPKQAFGPWAAGHRAAAKAIRQADAVIGLNPADHPCVLPLLTGPSRWIAMPPFLDAGLFMPRIPGSGSPTRLIATAMMRPGDKLSSYRVLGAALSHLLDLSWSLEIIGSGPARCEVMAALAPLGSRVIWAGALDQKEIARHLAGADLYVWPAINEAYGMALLEAQATGLPVVAGASGGVTAIIEDTSTGLVVPSGDAAIFAAAVRRLLVDADLRSAFGKAARRRVLAKHNLPAAAARLAVRFNSLCPAAAAPPAE
jgi:glycosyltransferase involved in cell wall biosynthesis